MSIQTYELKLIIRKAMKLIEGHIRFKYAFPTITERFHWNRTALKKASKSISQWPSPASVQLKYMKFHERFSVDDEYINDISTIVRLL